MVGQNDLDELDEWEEEYSVQRYVIFFIASLGSEPISSTKHQIIAF